MFQNDIVNATEIVLRRSTRVSPAGDVRVPRVRGAGGSATRVAAGALRIGNALGSVLAARRVHGPAERWLGTLSSIERASIAADGSTLTLGLADEAGVPEMVATLVAAGARIRRVDPSARTLEEVYLSLVGPTEDGS